MKIISKAYFLIIILIFAVGFNLFLLYQDQNSQVTQSYSIIRAGDLKVNSESISALAISVANGNLQDSDILQKEIEETQLMLTIIKNGGNIKGQTLEKIPQSLSSDYDNVSSAWEDYKSRVLKVESTSVFDQEATNAINYVLKKNQELILLTNALIDDLENLDRSYNPHKQIAEDLAEWAKIIGQQTLLISIGDEDGAQESLKQKRLEFEIGIRKLLQVSTADLDVESVGAIHENLEPIPRENSESLRKLDPLWESSKIKIKTIEERGILSLEYNSAKNEMNEQKNILFINIDSLIESWNNEITTQGSEEQIIIQILLIVDIIIFFIVLIVIRKTLSPLELITKAISRVKEGKYGEKIDYSGTDEVGQLVNSFNIMSATIKEKEEEAMKTDLAKDEFLAMITHELKTPLVPIQGYSDILLSEHLGKLNAKQKDRISIIKSSSETLLAMISDLLNAQKLELGQLKMKKVNTNIKDTIDKVIETLKPETTQNNIEISSNAVDLTLNYDPERISQVITNLIKNSLNAVEPNTGKIEIILENLPTEVKISIKDNGVGIPQEKQKELFKKFYQVDATLTREKGGSGLGLAICKGIIDNHQGQISVHSISNQGATFSFTIPKEISKQTKSPASST
ncbi:MAG: HAMP domain-containing histidine kinase [Thaumarchaeota archaeon]|nr:HAMP domain-containing histidine kinase [Nitrososphaerota archaeon]